MVSTLIQSTHNLYKDVDIQNSLNKKISQISFISSTPHQPFGCDLKSMNRSGFGGFWMDHMFNMGKTDISENNNYKGVQGLTLFNQGI